MEQSFIPQAYSKKQLALLYFPTAATPHAAVSHLMDMIRRTRGLYQELQDQGYNKYAKWFTPREVRLIVQRLGEP